MPSVSSQGVKARTDVARGVPRRFSRGDRAVIWGGGRTLVALAMVSLLLVWAVPVSAATGPLYAAGNLTLPEGVVFIPSHQGSHVWEGDHGLGVCHLDLTHAG